MRTFKRIQNRGFTLVELMIVVAIIGILAALAIYGVRKYMMNAKTAEAKEGIGRIAKDASSAYDREGMAGDVLELGASTAVAHQLCPPAAPVPDDVPAGEKYQSTPAQWNGTGWACLKFSMKDPQYYRYQYQATDTAASTGTFTAVAHGDLDGDATTSEFTLAGGIKQSGTDFVLVVAPNFEEASPEE